jgi:hypothetical protein
VRLLTSGPGAGAISYAGSAAAAASITTTNVTTTTSLPPSTKIRPRGLINSGSMYFANLVLQIVVYYPPFHRLFAELGRVLEGSGPSGSGGLGVSSGMSGINEMAGKMETVQREKRARTRSSGLWWSFLRVCGG